MKATTISESYNSPNAYSRTRGAQPSRRHEACSAIAKHPLTGCPHAYRIVLAAPASGMFLHTGFARSHPAWYPLAQVYAFPHSLSALKLARLATSLENERDFPGLCRNKPHSVRHLS
ncbi:hypothetical protein BN2475_910014 [Paraburkholderia ribeironis]|uniref:Uncharacterized protein n=1 Tax=Paraburkholderia ribeironis TaxID=1247936 RepID=A0A1N7SKU8_9BURK|nr:hypothetical protein BN2475_910014 [Paraburkholderia ribeironis]